MPFVKYCSIESYYRDKFIGHALEQYPELKDIDYLITEKLHGSNVGLVFEQNGKMTICSRNRILTEQDKHFGVRDVLGDECQGLVEKFTQCAIDTGDTITLHGEIFGPGIQKGINYGDKKRIRIFDMRVNGLMVSQKVLLESFEMADLERHLVPILMRVRGLEEAFKYDIDRHTKFTTIDIEGPNTCEGVVIKPYDKVYILGNGSTFYLKKKNESFSENGRGGKPAKERRSFSDTIHQLREAFLLLINQNRLASVFSKEGPIEEPKQMGHYIKLVMKDVVEDFTKDHGEALDALDKKERKYVLNGGKLIVALLKEHL